MDQLKKFELSAPRFAKGQFQLIAGLGGRFTEESVDRIPLLWEKFIPEIGKVPSQIGDETYGVCCNPDGEGGFEYIAGVAISKLDDLPEQAFFMAGTIEEAIEKAENIKLQNAKI